jgi:alpha-L-rhamnosidase
MGATTIWERWDSMLPDGSINPGEMTSFNHYALGSVGDWMYQHIGGIAPLEPGYRRIRIAPVPGGGLTWANCALRTPYGPTSCSWRVDGNRFTMSIEVAPNTSAVVVLPGNAGVASTVGSGRHDWQRRLGDEELAAWADEPSEVLADPAPVAGPWDEGWRMRSRQPRHRGQA